MFTVRNAVFALLFVNLAFMAWAHWIDVPFEPPVNQADARLPRLVFAADAPAAAPKVIPAAVTAPAVAPAAAAGPSDASIATLSPTARRCVSVGPFNDAAQAERAGSLLQERGLAPQQRSEASDALEGYWVYVGGLKSAADETRALHTLQEAGISDARAMAAADDGRRVSVGLFSDRTRAEKRARAVEHLGFSPDIVERHKNAPVFWLDLDLGTSDAAVPTEGLALADPSGSRIQIKVCP
jgi:hypothetical protein